MIVETGSLTFTGDVKPTQNNFAGLAATGRGAPGESFKDVSSGARAHLEHVLMYTGEHVANPVAERTRKVQEWGVLSNWRKTIKGPMSFAHLTQQWAPTSPGYARDIEAVGAAFYTNVCKNADPRPELVAEARKGRTATAAATTAARQSSGASGASAPSTGTALARRAAEQGRAENAPRSGLGATALVEEGSAEAETASSKKSMPLTILNAAKAEPDAAATTGANDGFAAVASAEEKAAGAKPPPIAFASAAGVAKAVAAPPPPAPTKCRVWTASYGGQKAIIIRATAEQATNFTVLDVNEGAEKREADAYIAAYAKGGQTVAEFANQAQALDKAFELCPEG
jgi:hypothetical protein